MKNFYKFLVFILCISSYSQVTNTFLAGSWECGNSEGITGSPATFSRALGIATDSNGNIYVADTDANIIRKITPDGSYVSTIAGTNGVSGNTDGIGTAAKFFKPKALAVDSNGNIYVADSGNNRIRKITPNGLVSTLAGSTAGYANGLGTAAKFNNLCGIVLDQNGSIFVVDRGAQTPSVATGRIRKIDSNGLVSDFYTPTRVFNPYGIARDSAGNFYISESFALGSNGISKINSSGILLNTNSNVGQGQTCIGNITIDSADNLYVTCHSNLPENLDLTTTAQSIRKISPTGYVSNVVTSGLLNALGLAINNNGDLIIADSWHNRILKYDTLGTLTNFAGPDLNSGAPTQSGEDGLGFVTLSHFNSPSGIVSDSNGNIYVADTGNNRIRKITSSGVVSTLTGSTAGYLDGSLSQAKFNSPVAITIDPNNNIYLAEMYGGSIKIRKISTNGIVSTIHSISSGGGTLNGGIVVDNNNNVFITMEHFIGKISSSGVFSEFVGSWNSGTSSAAGNLDGIGNNARFNYPRSLTSDQNGNIYVADFGNNRIRKVIPSGVVTTLAINANLLFGQLAGITYHSGVIYVNEYGGVIKKINSLQEVYLVCNQRNSGIGNYYGGISIVNNDIVFAVGCSIKKIANQVLEIDQNSFTNNQIHLFPNPAKDQLTIDLSSNLNLIGGNYKILNMLGQEVQNGTLNSQQNIIQLSNIKELGIYLVKIYDSSNSLLGTKKIIIQE